MYLFFDVETTGKPKNWKAPVSDTFNWPIYSDLKRRKIRALIFKLKKNWCSFILGISPVGQTRLRFSLSLSLSPHPITCSTMSQ